MAAVVSLLRPLACLGADISYIQPPVASLPPELLDSILGYLAPDDLTRKGDLRACSLVSRTWNVLAKPHLFRCLVLTIRQPAAWRQLYPEPAPDRERRPYWTDVEGTHIPRRTMEDVRHFFESSPTICHAVIDFKLIHFPSRLVPRLRGWGASSTSSHDYTEDDDCSYTLLTDALSLLPRLSTLRLFHFLPSNVDTGAVIPRSLRPGSLSFVKRLFVDLTGRDGEGDLNHADERLDLLLGYLEDLEVLHVSNFTYVTTTTELERFPHTFLRKQRRLNELTLDNAAMKASFFDAVRDSPAAGTIEFFDRTILMSPIGPDIRTVSALEDLVIRVGPHLTYLGYWVTPDGQQSRVFPLIKLTQYMHMI